MPHLAEVPATGIHPDPAVYAATQCRTAGGEQSADACTFERVGDLVLWQSTHGDGQHLSGITYVSPSHVLGADLVIGVYRTAKTADGATLPDSCVGLFSLLCSTIACPRNRALLRNYVPDFKPLTPREELVLRTSSSGATAKQVAESLGITTRTVDFHIQSAMAKLQCSTKSHAIVRAIRLGII